LSVSFKIGILSKSATNLYNRLNFLFLLFVSQEISQQDMSNISQIFVNSKKNAKQLLIDKLEDYLQKSKEKIEELEDKVSIYEAVGLETARKFNNFCKRILEIHGINQTIGTDKQILDIITEYKTSSESLRQKYKNFCSSIATLAQTIGEQPIDG
jgi:hypothetical protein